MTAPALHHRSLHHLIRDFSNQSVFRPLLHLGNATLAHNLVAPATIACWILQFHPEIAQRDSLHLVVMGASGPDAPDDGAWYSVLPWLMGNPELKLTTTLVGPELFGGFSFEERLRRTRAGTMDTFQGRRNETLRPARLVPTTARAFFDSKAGAEPLDLIFMFNPGFETTDPASWFDNDELSHICQKGVPIGLSAYCDSEAETDRWLARTHGYRPAQKTMTNPFRGTEHAAGAWAYTLWELDAQAPGQDFTPDTRRLERVELFCQNAARYSNIFEFPGSPDMGKLSPIRDARTGRPVGPAILLVDHGLAVAVETGRVHVFDESAHLPQLEGIVVSPEVLELYPLQEPYNFAHVEWAASVQDELCSQLANQEQSPDDERLFPFSPAEMHEHLADFMKAVTGEDIDPETFMTQMRLQGGIHGPVHPAWADLITSLGWDVTEYIEDPERFEAAFYIESESTGEPIPFVCENYAYIPGDTTDELANEAMAVLVDEYPEGVVLLFKAMCCQEVDGVNYSCGGYFYDARKWRPFALCESMKGVDDIFKQPSEGFSFEKPQRSYEDPNARLALALNALTHGVDPNNIQQAMGLRQGHWVNYVPE